MNLIKIRKVVSGLFFILFILLFTGGEKISVVLSEVLPPLQFVPALMRTLNEPAPLFIGGLIGIILITLIFGRVYCSFLCPLGTFQDILLAASRKFGGRNQHIFLKPPTFVRYSLLALMLVAVIFGVQSLISLMDPFALWGRIITDFFQPLLVGIYNLGILTLKPFDIYLYPKQSATITPSVMAVTAVFLILIVFLATTRGRLYCNSVCPVGTFLGILSRMSHYRFTLSSGACSECSRCERVCKAGCIDPQNASIDMSRCVACFDCLTACAGTTIRYRPEPAPPGSEAWSPARRGFVIAGTAAVTSAILASHTGLRSLLPVGSAGAEPPVSPPGSVSVTRFSRACTACSLCVAACPTSVLAPSFSDYGSTRLMQPKMNYEKGNCDYECNACSRICPTGAIAELALADKKLTAIGEAKLLEDVCVVYVDHRNCGACGEVCPTHAIRFVDKETVLYPEIDKQYCIGCGACQLACPTTPRSIVIHAHAVHKKADPYVPPATQALPPKTPASEQDFPF